MLGSRCLNPSHIPLTASRWIWAHWWDGPRSCHEALTLRWLSPRELVVLSLYQGQVVPSPPKPLHPISGAGPNHLPPHWPVHLHHLRVISTSDSILHVATKQPVMLTSSDQKSQKACQSQNFVNNVKNCHFRPFYCALFSYKIRPIACKLLPSYYQSSSLPPQLE